MERLSVDTNFFILLIEGNQKESALAKKLFERIFKEEDLKLSSSSLSITECLVAPIRDKANNIVKAFELLFAQRDVLEFFDFNTETARIAAGVRAKYNISTPDAIHIACAINSRSGAFVSEDKKLRKVKEIKVLSLRQSLKIYN